MRVYDSYLVLRFICLALGNLMIKVIKPPYMEVSRLYLTSRGSKSLKLRKVEEDFIS